MRITHWGIAVSVLSNALLNRGGSVTHVTLGWIVMALLVLRLLWGLVGPYEARFSAFPPNPLAALTHLRELLTGRVRDYPSHNPAGALMAYAFWATLLVVTATGLVMTGGATPMQVANDKAAVASGDWSALIREGGEEDESELSDAAKEVHEVAANLLLILAALHVAGVFVESRAMRRNLVAPMVLGERKK
ncbi:MAG: cytochrome b/b6 domain-containing protein [Tabrizicola sp.]